MADTAFADLTGTIVRSGDMHAVGALRQLVDELGPDSAVRILTDELPAPDSAPLPARLAVRVYDRLVQRGQLIGTPGELAGPLAATRAQLLDTLEQLVAQGLVDVAADGAELTVTRIEGRR